MKNNIITRLGIGLICTGLILQTTIGSTEVVFAQEVPEKIKESIALAETEESNEFIEDSEKSEESIVSEETKEPNKFIEVPENPNESIVLEETKEESDFTEVLDEETKLVEQALPSESAEILKIPFEGIQTTDMNRSIITSMWGTAPIEFNQATGVLRVFAGTLESHSTGMFVDDNMLISKDEVKEINFGDGVIAPSRSSNLFSSTGSILFSNLKKITGYLDTSNVTNMNSMFYGAENLTTIDVSNWNTSKVTTMGGAFFGTDLSVLDVSQWNTSNVTSMNNMFSNMSKITALDVSNWDTSKVTSMVLMFSNSPSLSELDFSSWDTSNVIKMDSMLSTGSVLRSLIVGEKSIFFANAGLKEISTSSKEYTGRWERIEPSSPSSVYESSLDFMRSYKGEMPGTYVWQKNVDLTSIKAKDSTIYSGTPWTAADNFISATDKNGNSIELAQVTVSGTVDTTTPGEYDVTYNYGGQSTTIKVTVIDNQETLVVKDSTIYVDSPWTAADNFISATDKNGNSIELAQVTVSGTVDTITPGEYDVTYNYGDQSTTIKVTVIDNQETLVVKDSTIYVDSPWTAADNFISATDKNGNSIELAQVTVSGTVDTTTPGEYDVTYNYGGQSTTIKVTVIDNQETLVVKDSTIYVDSPWTAADNFISATDKDGKEIDLSQVTVSGTVDNQTPGVYEINYTYKYPTRSVGKPLSKTAIITVLKSVPVDPNVPEVPTKPVVPILPTAPMAPEKPTNHIDYTSDLPQAGEKRLEQILFSLLGSITLVAAWCLGFGKYRKYEGN
ncbi:bacterial Ig-like domain-containing protein [Carnobacterium maltaromaticum]|uniref:bacterial Ig-like domain-containing protein n=1 Tax=Carnobacterium maltaromaticum TaxID=2751 RepID=UPI003B986F56